MTARPLFAAAFVAAALAAVPATAGYRSSPSDIRVIEGGTVIGAAEVHRLLDGNTVYFHNADGALRRVFYDAKTMARIENGVKGDWEVDASGEAVETYGIGNQRSLVFYRYKGQVWVCRGDDTCPETLAPRPERGRRD